MSDIAATQAENWQLIPSSKRDVLLEDLRSFIPGDILTRWKSELKPGKTIMDVEGPMFHNLGGGMAIRNRLRSILKDDELPPITYPDGTPYRNWDDFYLGALQALVEAHVPEVLPEDEIDVERDVKP